MRRVLAILGLLSALGTAVLAPPAASAGAATSPQSADYWLAAADGGVFAFGTAQFYGSMGGKPLDAPIVGISPGPSDEGYWLVASDGGVFAFGDAQFYGSMAGQPLNAPIVGMAPTPDGRGYWLVAADGGVFAFGDAQFYGSMAGQPLNAPIVSITPTEDGRGYFLAAADGGVFAFGDAPFLFSAIGMNWRGSPTVVGLSVAGGAPPSPHGYTVVASNGQQFSNETGPPQPNTYLSPPPTVPLDGPVAAFSGSYMATPLGEVLTTNHTHPGVTAVPLNAPIVGMYSFLANTPG